MNRIYIRIGLAAGLAFWFLAMGAPGAGKEEAAAPKPGFPPYKSGGEPSGIAGKKTGSFHAERIEGRWWIVDPNGQAGLALGVDHVAYQGHWCEKLGYNPYEKKNDAKYASRADWEQETLERLKSWNFNLLGATLTADTALHGRSLAHCLFPSVGTAFAGLGGDHEICPFEQVPGTAFPNVFHPEFRAWCESQLRDLCTKAAADPWLFGYFLDNEMAWWGRRYDVDYGLFDAVMRKGAGHSAKMALRDWLKSKYPTVQAFNAAWKADLASFDDLLKREQLGGDDIEAVIRDKREFVALLADAYFRVATESIRRFDPNHMILGCRFAQGRASEAVWAACGRYCDICTFNYYGNVDLDRGLAEGSEGNRMTGEPLTRIFERFHEMCGRPVMITEWSFCALDAVPPSTHGPGQRFFTQRERAEAAGVYLESILRMPFMVGSDYFMWIDEPALGIHPAFPENGNYGLVNEDGKPYPELTEALRGVQARAVKLHLEGPAKETPATPAPREGPRLETLVARLAPDDAERLMSETEAPPPAQASGEAIVSRGSLRFEKTAQGFRAGNGRMVFESDNPTTGLTTRIRIDGLVVGRYNTIVFQEQSGGRSYAEVNRLLEARPILGQAALAVELTGRWEKPPGAPAWAQPYEVRHRLFLFPDRPWAIARMDWVRNLGDGPLVARGWRFHCPSFIRGDARDDEPVNLVEAPQVWKARQAAAWIDPAGGFLSVILPFPGDANLRFWVDKKGVRRIDGRFFAQETIAPGATHRPSAPAWVFIAAGQGSRDEWRRLAEECQRLARD